MKMTCYKPLSGFQIGLTKEGKKNLKIMPGRYDMLVYDKTRKKYFGAIKKETPHLYLNGNYKIYDKPITIPCGQCQGCRMDYARKWADRLMMEKETSKSCYFITLTYDDKNLEFGQGIDEETGEVFEKATLRKKDLQDYIKRQRKHGKFRYYASGEYGDKTARPHYHMIAFNLYIPETQKKYIKRSELGFEYFTSPYIEKTWGKGQILLTEVNWQTCSYVARYVMKKQTGEKATEAYEKFNIEPPFVIMSTKPAIGSEYMEQHKEKLIEQKHVIMADGQIVGLPRYFERAYEEEYQEEIELIKEEKRRLMDEIKKAKEAETGRSLYDLNKALGEREKTKFNRLVRNKI